MKVLIVGNPIDGIRVMGPVEHPGDVNFEQFIGQLSDEDWWIVNMEPMPYDDKESF